MGKSHQLNSQSSFTTYTQPLELIFCDLWGPSHVHSSLGYNYYISFVDAYSRYTWISFINHKIKAVQTDWGGEFRPLTQFLHSVGIHHRLICPHTHHQNGVIERKHRHIVEIGLTLLSQSSLPLKFWDHAFHTAVYLINRLPTSVVPHSVPYSLIFHKDPNYHFLRVFGCACYPHTRPYNHHKLAFCSTSCTFLGYSSCHKGYKCLDSHGRLFISKDVIFDEHTFPFSCTSPTLPSSTLQFRPHPLGLLPTPVAPPIQHAPLESTSVLSFPVSSIPTSSPVSSSPTLPPSSSAPDLPLATPQSTSTHPMQTRSKSGIIKPRLYPSLLITTAEPHTVKQALSSPLWRKAMHDEYDALLANNTWSLSTLPSGRSTFGCKWIFRIKENPDGTVNRYKARLVAKGFHQKFGCDYSETFSLVVKPITIRIILTLAVTHHWSIQHIDINNAFLHVSLHEDVYMTQPPGFESVDSPLVCKLHKSIYGLKQAPRAWYEKFTTTLIGFCSCREQTRD